MGGSKLSTPWRVMAVLLALIYSGGAALLLFDYLRPGQLQEWSWELKQRVAPWSAPLVRALKDVAFAKKSGSPVLDSCMDDAVHALGALSPATLKWAEGEE